ncbi:MAG: aspartate kinase [Deltaproteobacteria bacterium]|nr:aspartate kinase [Deltaproteobacteria bacterium]MBI3390815.1 aspartate kinase [Deltaproteobacteria bacterium]
MQLIVQKYGGTSVGTAERIRAVAERVTATHQAGNQVVVTVSAMAGETNRLLGLAREVSPDPQPREVDVLLATGEQAAVALLAMALRDLGTPAQSFLGHQIRIATDSVFGKARIKRIDADNLLQVARGGTVAVVAGFQGVDENENITTLGRGGGDTTAVAVAAAVKADVCEIYTDVEGVFTTDPRICPGARKLARISFDEMLELASLGAKVLQIRAVEFAKRYQVPLHVRSSFSNAEGTWVVPEEHGMEDVLVSGVTLDRDESKITLRHVPDRPGLAMKVFGPIAAANIVVDMIIQNASADGFTDLTFTVPRTDFQQALGIVEQLAREVGAGGVATATDVAKVSIVGLGMRSHAGVAAKMFEVLSHEGINIQMISTSEIKVSVVIEAKYAELAVRVLHEALVERGLASEVPA